MFDPFPDVFCPPPIKSPRRPYPSMIHDIPHTFYFSVILHSAYIYVQINAVSYSALSVADPILYVQITSGNGKQGTRQ